jgi:hypothetical protein
MLIEKKLIAALPVTVRTDPSSLVILGAVNVRAVVKESVLLLHWSSSTLVLEVPVETGEGSVLLALVLKKQGTLLNPEFLKISGS